MPAPSNSSTRSSSSRFVVKLKTKLKNVFGIFTRGSERDAKHTVTDGVVEIPTSAHMGQTVGAYGTYIMGRATESQWPQAQMQASYTNDQMTQAGPWSSQYNNGAVGSYYDRRAAVVHPNADTFNDPGHSALSMRQNTYTATYRSAEGGYTHDNYTYGTAQVDGHQANWRRNDSMSVAPGNNINFGGRVLRT